MTKASLLAPALILAAMPVFSAERTVDFDGNGKKTENVITHLNDKTANDLVTPAIPEGTDPSKSDANGIAAMKVVEILESGEEIVRLDTSSESEENHLEVNPNAIFYWELICTGQNPNPWNGCFHYEFRPNIAGHNHQPPYTLSFKSPDNQPLPSPVCRDGIPVNTPFRINFKAPVFSAKVLIKVKFSGACQGTVPADLDIKVTANDVIQLSELVQEPYYVFKPTSKYHPSNRFATPDTNAKLKQIAKEYYQIYHPTTDYLITMNDMGLVWGGRYHSPFDPNEVPKCWTDGQIHFYHRYGRQVDVRSWNINTPEKRKCFEEIACKYLVEPILEGKAPEFLSGRDFSNISLLEADALDRVEHYHLNFARPTDPPVYPRDDARTNCPPGPVPTEESACPKPIHR